MTPDMPAMDEKGLKSCPFCGGEPFLNYAPGWEPGTADKTMANISCTRCFTSQNYASIPKTIAAWNRRASLKAVPEVEVVKALREAYEAAKYQPGDFPLMPHKTAAFMRRAGELLSPQPASDAEVKP